MGANPGLADKYFLGYGLSNLMAISLGASAALLIWVFCLLRSSKHPHDSVSVAFQVWTECVLFVFQMLHSVMRAPLNFFETTLTGRCVKLVNCEMISEFEQSLVAVSLNLFSRDTYVVDQILARFIQNMIRTSAVCASILLVIGFSFPPFLIAVLWHGSTTRSPCMNGFVLLPESS